MLQNLQWLTFFLRWFLICSNVSWTLCKEHEGDYEIEAILSGYSKLIRRDPGQIRTNAAQAFQIKRFPSWVGLCFGCQVERPAYKKECGEGCLYAGFQSKYEFLVAR